jgi:hypothetical protein
VRVWSHQEIHAVSGSASGFDWKNLGGATFWSGITSSAGNMVSGLLLVAYLALTGRTIADIV